MSEDLIRSLIPLILIQLIFQTIAIVDIVRKKKTRNLSVWIWATIVIFGEIFGVIFYFLFGREED